MAEFSRRLVRCMRQGRMTVADLSHWFSRPYPTVRTWVYDRRQPEGPAGDEAERLLRRLERRVRDGLVIPVTLSKRQRPAYVKKLRHAGDRASIPSSRPA